MRTPRVFDQLLGMPDGPPVAHQYPTPGADLVLVVDIAADDPRWKVCPPPRRFRKQKPRIESLGRWRAS